MENQEKKVNTGGFALSKKGVPFLIAGILLVVIGFYLMSGGKSDNPEVFNPELFSKRRIVIAPIVILLGYTLSGVGIMLKSK